MEYLYLTILVKQNWTTGIIREELALLDSLSKSIIDKKFMSKLY